MIYFNLRSEDISFRVGNGPGRFTQYDAKPGCYVDGPEGYKPQFKRFGLTPIDEIPVEQREKLSFNMNGQTRLGKDRPRHNKSGLVDPDSIADDGASQAREAAAMPTPSEQPAVTEPTPMPPADEPEAAPVAGNALQAKASLVATGTMRVETVEPQADDGALVEAPLMPSLPGMPPARAKAKK